jgi:hypothetical protein
MLKLIKSESNIEEGIRKKEEGAIAPALLATSSASPGTSSPDPSLSANDCYAVRNQIRSERNEISNISISFMRLSLLTPDAQDYGGHSYARFAVNMDVSFNNNREFKKFKWRLTDRRREFYTNIPDGWEDDIAYGSAWKRFAEIEGNKWIGKACYRLARRGSEVKLKLAPFTAMVMWAQGDEMHYELWIENAHVAGTFNIGSDSKHYMASSQPIKNFTPSGFEIIKL